MNFDLNEEQRMWRDAVHDFVAREVKPFAREVDETSTFNSKAVRKMGSLGLLGLAIPEEYGGAGVDAVSAAIAIEELGWGCGSTALAVAAHNGLGTSPIVLFGNEEQKKKFLPRVASGEGGLGALALTEPGAGSDLQGVQTRATRDGDHWVLNGTKAWCTNASIAEYIIVFLRTNPDGGTYGFSHIVVPTQTPGLHIAPAEKKMGLKGSPTHMLTFDQARVPVENLIGSEGRGLHQTLSVLDGGRVSIGALAVGLAQSAMEDALAYAKQREAFGHRIADFQAIHWMA